MANNKHKDTSSSSSESISSKKMKEILDLIHIKIHGIRMLDKYKPSQFESDLNKIIAELYENKCKECNAKFNMFKYGLTSQQPKSSFFGGLFGQ